MSELNTIIDNQDQGLIDASQSYLWEETNQFLQNNFGNAYQLNLIDISEIAQKLYAKKVIVNLQKDIELLKQNYSFNKEVCKALVRSYWRPIYSSLARKLVKLIQRVAEQEIINEEQLSTLLYQTSVASKVDEWFDGIVDVISEIFWNNNDEYFIVQSTDEIKTIEEQEEIISTLKAQNAITKVEHAEALKLLKETIIELENDKDNLVNEFAEARKADASKKDQEKDEMISYIKKITNDTEKLVQENDQIQSNLKSKIKNIENELYSERGENHTLSSRNATLLIKSQTLQIHKKRLIIVVILSILTIIGLIIALSMR